LLDGVGEGLRGEHRCEAGEGNVGSDEEDRRRDGDGCGGGEMAALRAEEPRYCWAKAECECCESGGKAERGEAGAGEVEETGHGEGVVADAAAGEEIADVGHEGEVTRCPETVGECDSDGDAQDGEDGVCSGDQTARGWVEGEGLFGAGEGCGEEDQEWEVHGEGVVLLVGGQREEDQDE